MFGENDEVISSGFGKDDEVVEQPSTEVSKPRKSIVGNIMEAISRPGSAVRAPFFGKSPVEGFKQPETIPTFKKSFEETYWRDVGKQAREMEGLPAQIHPYLMAPGGMVTSALGLGADIATDPMNYLYGGVAKLISKTPVGMAIGRFLTKERHLPDLTKPIKEYKKLSSELRLIGKNYDDIPLSEIPRKLGEEAKLKEVELSTFNNSFKDSAKVYADEGAIAVKPKVKEFGEKLTKTYDTKIDQVDDILIKSDDPINITRGEVASDWLDNAVNNLSGNPKEQVRLIGQIKKIGYDVLPGAATDDIGNVIYNVTTKDPEIPLTFRDLIDYKNNITAIKGDASSSIRHSFVDFLSDDKKFPFNVSQVYKDMQEGYGPLAQTKWKAYKIFKPFDKANVDTKQASRFFEEMAVKNIDAGNQRLVKLIEEGSDFSPGVGDISSTIRKFGVTGRQKSTTLSREVEDIMSSKSLAEDFLAKRKKIKDDALKLLELLGMGAIGEEVLRRTILKR